MPDIPQGFASIQQSNLLTEDTCGTTARAVFQHFRQHFQYNGQPQLTPTNGGIADLVREWQTPQQAIYLVCVNTSQQDFALQEHSSTTGDIWKWEHYFAIHQHGLDFMVYQAFVNCYNLGEWCSGVFTDVNTAPKLKYSPQGNNVPLANFARWVENLQRCVSAADATEAGRISRIIFGGAATSSATLKNSHRNGFKVRWLKRSAGAAPPVNNNAHKCNCCIIL